MKMKTTIYSLAFASLMMLASPLKAQRFVSASGTAVVNGYQSRDQDLSELPKMERDIIILQNVLSDMFSSDDYFRLSSSSTNKGIYIPGKGVIFNVNDQSLHARTVLRESGQIKVMSNGANNESDEQEMSIEEANKQRESNLTALAKEFLLNYGSVLTELKDSEQIMLNVQYGLEAQVESKGSIDVNFGRYAIGTKGTKRISSSIQFRDLKDLLSGKLSFEAAKGKVTTKVTEDETKESSDTKIMAGILDDLFRIMLLMELTKNQGALAGPTLKVLG